MIERPILFNANMVKAILAGTKTQTRRIVKGDGTKCPYGQPGDILWVRENFIKIPTGCKVKPVVVRFPDMVSDDILSRLPLRPSIHLPKADSRIWLKVKKVDVEHVQKISEADAIAEGVEKVNRMYRFYDELGSGLVSFASDSYRSLWYKINGGDSWNENPLVWVVTFEVLSTKGKPDLVQKAK